MDKGIKNFKSILLILAYLLFILGLILLIPLLIALAFKENKIILISYLVPGLTSLLIGTIISYIFRNNTIQLNLANSMITVTLAWAISALIGSIPLIISINMSFIDAYF